MMLGINGMRGWIWVLRTFSASLSVSTELDPEGSEIFKLDFVGKFGLKAAFMSDLKSGFSVAAWV